jgi:pyridoxal phosphate enzyme (YggS family)
VIDSRPALEARVAEVRWRIELACARARRDPEGVRLVAAAKGVKAELVRWAVEAGIRDIGENYVKEMTATIESVGAGEATWHYVGALQSSTAHRVADLADVVHSLVLGRGAERLSGRAERGGRRITSLLQVDFTGERQGVAPEDAADAADELRNLPGLELRGLMTLPPLTDRAEDARPYFRRLRELRDGMAERVGELRELSMGMSGDFEVAVEEGATMIRIGTALFGERPLTRV